MANTQGDIIVGVSLDSKKAQAQLQDFQNRFSKTKEITTKVTLKGGTEALKVVRQYEDAVNKTKISTQQLMNVDGTATQIRDKYGKIISNCTEKITKYEQGVQKATTETKNFTEVEKKASANTNEFGLSMRSLGETFIKVAKFKIVTEVLMTFINMGNEAIEIVKEFDDAMVEFAKVSELSGDALDKYAQKLGELGEVTMKSRTQMLESATEFVKSGYSEDQSAELAQIATMFQNVADSELSAGDSASYVISQMKAFGMTTTDEAQSIIDKTNEVSNNFAVSSTDISSALTKTSSAMATYGNSIDETIALTYI